MRRALRLAARGFTPPNPMVGCVLVRDGQVVGEGYHLRAGEPHAEVMALRNAGRLARGATAYVNLEPCAHFGRTPPCSHALISAGVRQVIAAVADPNPLVGGRGMAELAAAGIDVAVGLLESEARELNAAFFHFQAMGTPLVSLKAATTLDGKIATRTGDSKWITGDAARKYVHRLRAQSGAVLCGIGTVQADDPLLTSRLPGVPRQPLRIVLDAHLRIPAESRLVKTAMESPVLVVASEDAKPERARLLVEMGVEILPLPADKEGRISLDSLLKALGAREVISVLVEGGGQVHASFLEARLAHRLHCFVAPKVLGGRAAPTWVEGHGIDRVSDAIAVERLRSRRLGRDVLIEGLFDYREAGDVCDASRPRW